MEMNTGERWGAVVDEVICRAAVSGGEPSPDRETRERYRAIGEQAVRLFYRLLDALARSPIKSVAKRLEVYRRYIASDTVTLAALAPDFYVSRERIRQYIVLAKRKANRYLWWELKSENPDVCACIEELAGLLEAVECDVISLIAYGWSLCGRRLVEAMLVTLFGEETGAFLLQASEPLSTIEEHRRQVLRRQDELMDQWALLAAKICYPSKLTDADPALPEPCQGKELNETEQRFYKKLKRLEAVIDVVSSPDVVYCREGRGIDRPSLAIRTPEGRCVLVLVVSTINMASAYYVRLFNALHLFCARGGYGYLIMDDRGNSIYDLKSRLLDPDAVSYFDGLLRTKGGIRWADVKAWKEHAPFPNEDLVAYVLQRRLRFSRNPFYISAR